MKFVTIGNDLRIGVLFENKVIDLYAGYITYLRKVIGVSAQDAPRYADKVFPRDMTKFIELGNTGIQATRKVIDFVSGQKENGVARPIDSVRLGPPVPLPPKIIGVARNYQAFAREAEIETPKFPLIFMKARSSIIGPEDLVVLPKMAKKVTHEIELAVVIGKGGRMIREDEAFDHIFGYTIIDDITASDIVPMYGGRGQFIAKSFYTFAPIGPCLVLKEEIKDPHNLNIQLKVNGEVVMTGNTKDMRFKIPCLVSFISNVLTLEPGDIIATGTPMGYGPLKPGDVCEAEIENIGVLRYYVGK